MDQNYSQKPSSPPSQLGQWPNAPAQRGKFYGVKDPVFKTDMLCVMTMETWTDVGTFLAKSEEAMKKQAEKIKEVMAANASLEMSLADANSRLNSLRDVRRSEMRADLEKELILPGNRAFVTPTINQQRK